MTHDELELWDRIKSFKFDRPNTQFTFAKRLAKENAFTPDFAPQVIEEYRKFIFLCCVSSGQIAPSHLVDLAWHLHLTYTRSYWTELCGNTIGRDLHHNPTQGGVQEDRKFKGQYQDTLALYKQYFRTDPPRTIWPEENIDAQVDLVEVDKDRNWIIPKPAFNLSVSGTTVALFAVIMSALFLGACTTDTESFGVMAIGGLVVGGIFLLLKKGNNRRGRGSSSSGCGSIMGTSGCGSDGESSDNCDSSDSSDCSDSGGGDSGCSSGCGGGCGGGGD